MEEDSKYNVKISGYLEKKGRMKVMSSYKKYWFVLEGRLLLYYRSKDEYEAISPCKGSINLGPPCNIKPCPSLVGVFQIETRTNTVTLRAENREDQNRWMQGIISALNQNKNATKLSHFRYSLDELPKTQENKTVLERQNSVPHRMNSPKNQSNKGIIQRLQKIGAQTYCASVNTVNKMAYIKKYGHEKKSNSDESLENSNPDMRNSILVENDQYEVFKKNDDAEQIDMRNRKGTENIYERISGDSTISENNTDHNYSVPIKKNNKENRKYSENEDICDILQNKESDLNKPDTFILENESYSISTNLNKENVMEEENFVLENDQYCSIDRTITNRDSEVIYTEPKFTEFIDHNKNNLVINNDKHFSEGEENAYSITKLYDSNNATSEIKNEYEYEDLEKYAEYTEPKEDIYSECTNVKNKSKKEKKCKHKDNLTNDTKEFNLKKTSSFIKRVWKKKVKHKEIKENIDELYETVPPTVVDKLSMTNGTAVQMLSELHSILEHKKPVLVKRLSSGKSSSANSAKSEPTTIANNNLSTNENIKGASSSVETDICPLLPAKSFKTDVPSPYHDFPKNNQPVNKVLPLKKKQKLDNIKSLDEILNYLDKHQDAEHNENKVKQLIKRFSEPEFTEKDVILRANERCDFPKAEIDSDELSKLLDELAKVTNAPILTPGVTSSLIGTNIADNELMKLLPTRRRRHSEPDYDIPRPHKSLINLPKKENPNEIVIESTRFFGPILKPSDIYIKRIEKNSPDSSQLHSMTPDSLELDPHLTKTAIQQSMHQDEKNSYTSHNYFQENKLNYCDRNNRNKTIPDFKNSSNNFANFDGIIIENDIYAQPKLLYDFNTVKEQKPNENNGPSNYKSNNTDSDDVFIDSLEICSEKSTAF